MAALQALLATVSGIGSAAERARLLATGLPSLLRCLVSGVALLDSESSRWELWLWRDAGLLPAAESQRFLTDLESCLCESFARSEVLALSDGIASSNLAIPASWREMGVTRLFIAPIMTLSRQLGAVILGRSGETDLSRDEELFISTIAEQSAIGFENLQLQQSLEKFSAQLQHRYDLILEAAGEGIYGLDSEGRATFSNRAANEILGWQEQEIAARPIHDIHHHSHADGTPYPIEECPIYAALKDGEVHRVDSEVFWKRDGTAVPVEYTSTPIMSDGRPVGAVVVFRDISKRRTAEAEREAAYEEIKSLKEQLEQERDYLRDEINVAVNFGQIVGESEALKQTLRKVEAVADTQASVLVLGESGVGKEMIARAIHTQSERRDRPLVKVNCASIPKELFESEFFGHVRGAFTGAHKDRIGRFQLADGGTLFLDEIGEIPLALQSKLLRALQEHAFERVGDDKTISVDVRIVAASNRDLEAEAKAGRFREDLYYRLSVFPIEVPPLRERVADIVPLASHFLARASQELGRDSLALTEQQAKQLKAHNWPGNIRELNNVIERAAILSRGSRLRLDLAMPADVQGSNIASTIQVDGTEFLTDEEFRKAEKNNIVAALRHAKWRIWGDDGAAALLAMKPSTLAYRMKSLGIAKPKE